MLQRPFSSNPLALWAFILPLLISCAERPANEHYVARLGESTLTDDQLTKMLPQHTAAESSDAVSNAIEEWARKERLFLHAVRTSPALVSELDNNVEDYRKTLYGQAFLDTYLSRAVVVNDEEIRSYYQRHRDLFLRASDEFQLLHFRLESESEAQAVKRALLRYDGSLRKELSGKYAVEFKTIHKGMLIPEIDGVLFGPKRPHGILGPIRSSFGYHVLEILDFFPANSLRGLDEVYDSIYQLIFREKSDVVYRSLMDSLSSVYTLEINPDFSGKE